MAMQRLDVTRKKASTEAFQAHTQENLFKEFLFWSQPLPLGVVGTPRYKLIDVDEFAFALEKLNRPYAYSISCYRVRKLGHYTRNTKLTVIFAIEPGDPRLPAWMDGSIEKPRRWIRVVRVSGTNATLFADFCDHVCSQIEANPIPLTDDHRVFIWDNLGAHKSPIVSQTVEARGGPLRFSICNRIPYQPKYGPIEYKICDLITQLRLKENQNWTTDGLETAILQVAATLGKNGDCNFDRTFEHCGYSVDGTY
jgi:hypothetical protein